MVGGGTALDSHSRVTDFPARTFTTTGESPLLSLMLGGTGEGEQHLPLGTHQWLDVCTAWAWTHWKLWGRCACVLLLQHSWPHSCTSRHQTLLPSESVVSDRLEARKIYFFLLNAYYQEFCFHAKALPWLALLFFMPLNVSQSHGTWHDECIAIRLDGAPFISPAECGRRETSGFTGEGHKVVHHHTQRLRVWPDNGGRHWGKGAIGGKKRPSE